MREEELVEAVADSSRRRVLDLLLARGELTPTALAAELPFTRQAVAKHLAVLDRAGLVEGRRTGREVRYSVRPEHLDVAARAMARLAARWDARLEAIKSTAEARARAAGATSTRSLGRRRPLAAAGRFQGFPHLRDQPSQQRQRGN